MEWFLRQRLAPVMSRFLMVAIVSSCALAQAQSAAASPSTRLAGTLKSVEASSLTLTSDAGKQVVATVDASTRILQIAPGQTDLKQAQTVTLQDLRPGDRVVVRGQGAADNQPLQASLILLMKQADVSAKQQQQRDDWQKRGVGGIVTAVDAAHATVTINAGGIGVQHAILIHVTDKTLNRRYAPASVKYESATTAPLSDIQVGDQLRARGTRSADRTEFVADEIVSGTFRNIAGTVIAVDTAEKSFSVQDLIQKKPVTVKLVPDSQMKSVPPEVAQRLAAAVKASGAQNGSSPASAPSNAPAPHADATGVKPRTGGADLERFLARMPDANLADLKKGDAVMIVTTPGQEAVTVITLLTGVEPILTAAPKKNAAALSPWTLGASAGEGESGP